jgi:hypothetical protein
VLVPAMQDTQVVATSHYQLEGRRYHQNRYLQETL